MTQYFDVIKGELINLSDSENESESEEHEQSKGSAKMVSLNGESPKNKEEDVDEYTKEIAEQKQVKME